MGQYKKTILVYLDILGFKDLIQRSSKDEGEVVSIVNLLDLMKEEAGYTMLSTKPDGRTVNATETLNFSDLVIRATRLEVDDDLLRWANMELRLLCWIQCRLATQYGILIRGGICIGDVYMQDELIFGPALVRAYELAEKLAIFPRIAIDSQLITDMKAVGLLLNAFRTVGEDGTHFVDYLYGAYTMPDPLNMEKDRFRLLWKHKELVEGKLKELSNNKDERLKQKAKWLGLYHNRVVARLMSEPSYSDERPRFNGVLLRADQIEI